MTQSTPRTGYVESSGGTFLASDDCATPHPSTGEISMRYWNDLPLARKGVFVALLPVASLLIGFASLYGLSVAERRAQDWVEHTLKVRTEIARAIAGIVTDESCARGFLVTRSPDFLHASAAARKDVTKALTSLAALTVESSSEGQGLASIRDLINERHRVADATIAELGTDPAASSANLATLVVDGQAKTDALRNVLEEMDAAELRLKGQRTTRVEQLRDINLAATAATVALAIGGGCVSIFLLSRSTVRRIQLIGENAERLAAELPLQEASAGKDEIGRLNEQLKATSSLLSSRTKALRESEARLQAILDQTSSVVFVKDLDGRFLMVNRSFEKLFGINRLAAIGHSAHAMFPSEFADAFRTNDLAAVASAEPLQFEEVAPQRDGLHTFLSTKFALRDAHDIPYAVCGIATDITERKRAEQILRSSRDELEKHVAERTTELQQANTNLRREVTEHRETAESLKRTHAQLLQAQKMKALGQIAGGIAHDFNNILTTIMGHAMLLLQQLPDVEREASSEAEILRASDRAGALSKQLLSFSRPQPTAPVVLNVNSVVEHAEKMLTQAIGGRIVLRKTLDPALGNARADVGQVEQLLLNLVINARDAIPGNGEIEIITGNVSLKPDDVKCGVATTEFVSLSVRDTGSGISPELMARVFEPFFTTKRPGQGTGLGLATCSAIVQQCDGWIACQSQPGKGTQFTVFLPRLTAPVADVSQTRLSGSLPTGRETLLVVEDEPAVGNLFELLLRKLGYEVIRAQHGEDAERVIAERAEGAIDLILTDVDMPRMGGSELVRRLARNKTDMKVILTSGNGENFAGTDDPAFAFEFLPKPFSMQTLAQKVREVLDR